MDGWVDLDWACTGARGAFVGSEYGGGASILLVVFFDMMFEVLVDVLNE